MIRHSVRGLNARRVVRAGSSCVCICVCVSGFGSSVFRCCTVLDISGTTLAHLGLYKAIGAEIGQHFHRSVLLTRHDFLELSSQFLVVATFLLHGGNSSKDIAKSTSSNDATVTAGGSRLMNKTMVGEPPCLIAPHETREYLPFPIIF